MPNSMSYDDGVLACLDDALLIRRYYFPFAVSKRVPYADIRRAKRFTLTGMTGKYRAWGSGNLTQWFNLDLRRTRKSVGLVLDLGRRMQPVITPDDPERVIATLAAHGVQITD